MFVVTELLSKVITKPVEDAVKAISKKTADYLVDKGAKNQIDIGLAYEEYLKNIYAEYAMSKSFLYRDKKRKLSSFFVPLDIKPLSRESLCLEHKKDNPKEDENKLSTKDIATILKQGNKLIITGTGGMGKTLLMKYFCVSAIENGLKIPIFISLRELNDIPIDSETFEEQIYKYLSVFGFKLEYQYFKYSLESDKYLFLFDGYDEIKEEKQLKLSLMLYRFSEQYPHNSFIISSRLIDSIFSWEDFQLFSICNMTIEQAIDFVWMLDYEDTLKKKFTNELTNRSHGLYYRYKSFASVPLLLSVLLLTYAAHARLPETLNEFYEKAFEALLFENDRMTKLGFKRIFRSELTYVTFRNVFIRFCFITYFEEMYSFSSRQVLVEVLLIVLQEMKIDINVDAYLSDLLDNVCMLIKEGEEYTFLHRSFQEYFAAVYVAKKNDIKQSEFCLDYINSPASKIGESILQCRFCFSPSKCKWYDSVSFLRMLQSIEPDRFESIILDPIMKKVYDIYQNNNDLVNTALACTDPHLLSSFKELIKYMSIDSLYCLETDVAVSENELLLLRRYWFLQDQKRITNPDLERQANSFLELASSKDIQGYYNSSRQAERFIKDVIYPIAMSIERYETICQQKEQNNRFSDLLEKF